MTGEPTYKNVKGFYTPIDRVFHRVYCKCGNVEEFSSIPRFCSVCGRSWKEDKKSYLAFMRSINWGWGK